MTEPAAPTVLEALARVARRVGPVGKSGTAAPEMGHYAFRRYDDVIDGMDLFGCLGDAPGFYWSRSGGFITFGLNPPPAGDTTFWSCGP